MVERESKVKTKASTKKKLLIAAGVVVVALAAALIFISNYLVNYAIGRSGNVVTERWHWRWMHRRTVLRRPLRTTARHIK